MSRIHCNCELNEALLLMMCQVYTAMLNMLTFFLLHLEMFLIADDKMSITKEAAAKHLQCDDKRDAQSIPG